MEPVFHTAILVMNLIYLIHMRIPNEEEEHLQTLLTIYFNIKFQPSGYIIRAKPQYCYLYF